MVVVDDQVLKRAQAAVEALNRRTRVRAAYLFGSQVTGAADEESDIDVAAFLEDDRQLGLQNRVRLGVQVREQAGDDMELHFLPAAWLDAPPVASFAAYVIDHGVRFWGTHEECGSK